MNNLLKDYSYYKKLDKNIQAKNFPISVSGISDTAYVYLILQLFEEHDKMFLVFPDSVKALSVFDELSKFTEDIRYLPDLEINYFNVLTSSHDTENTRLKAIYDYYNGDRMIVVSTVESTMLRMADPEIYKAKQMIIKTGEDYDYDEFLETLLSLSYERVYATEAKGQFSVKGGIVDIFPVTEENPVRIEFFGDEVYSLRVFDPETQLSNEELESVDIHPAKEGFLSEEEKSSLIEKLKTSPEYEGMETAVNDIVSVIRGDSLSDDIYKYITLLDKEYYSLFDYFSNALVLFDSIDRLYDKVKRTYELHEIEFETNLLKGNVLPEQFDIYMPPTEWTSLVSQYRSVFLSSLYKSVSGINYASMLEFDFSNLTKYYGKLDVFTDEVKDFIDKGYRVWLYFNKTTTANNIVNMLMDASIVTIFEQELDDKYKYNIAIACFNSVETGFISKDFKTVVITEKDIFNKPYKTKSKKIKNTKKIKTFTDIDIDDYIVHEYHGIGRYKGVELVETLGEYKDMIKIEYQKGDFLYVPVDRMQSLHKYIGADAESVKVDSLDSNSWSKLKNKAKKSIKNIAKELVKLYSERESADGFAFSKDDVWQVEFEESFPYAETDDQLKCIEEIKRDMEKPVPMERLLCGDVGYGKTEVALRAVFKAVTNGKQAAILVPTTILAEQHYNTIVKRFGEFPINVEVLNRFRTRKNQLKTLENLKSGVTEVVVGTHRLLSKDVEFKDLGLLVIDEEQRFGVTHKEKIKKLKSNVDTLTLSATPIPRTLNMSLMGVRDLSVIEDPPENRYPIQTYVLEYDDNVIRNAMLREVERGGQVYYVHNRVLDIDLVHLRVSNLVPELRVAYAHGRMKPRELEKIIVDFMDGNYDVLISTTIIETGVDIPNVNTIIIDRSDTFGLSQLYQLRGRVGRSDKLAYAYLTYDKGKVLNQIADKRLSAIKEFTDLGSGFKLSMRDLEIRGAGNLFGSEQHGHLVNIGYEMYLKILKEEIDIQKGIKPVVLADTKVEFSHSSYIPDDYISDYRFKIEMYKKISSIDSLEMMSSVREELEDRFGDLPQVVINLIYISTIRYFGSVLGFSKVIEKKDRVLFVFDEDFKVDKNFVNSVLSSFEDTLNIKLSPVTAFEFVPSNLSQNTFHTEILYETYLLISRIYDIYNSCEKEK